MWVRSRRINKRALASPESTIMTWACFLLVIVRASFGRGRAVAIRTPASAATVAETHRTENASDRGDLDMCMWGIKEKGRRK
ncbi:hypothetical protein AVEN_45611-1 [Araneus ventricosus]|uniref:Uncharacterized protein n=1 Tax=Araneus ventricosus TaxID=182803 RepID=A0A4Y2U1S4_ARAVE|nr:hypothetical protein AVEN_45611-1 [Araneus ventricosus]